MVRGDCGTANGVTNFVDRTVRVRPDIDDLQAVKTLAHELGHVLLHEPVIGEPVVPCRGTAEVEAESLAYLVTASQGLTTDQYSFPYVLGWATAVPNRKPEDVVAEVGKRVIRAANQVLAALDPVDDRAVSLATERAVEATNRTASLRESAATLEEAVAGPSPMQQRERLIAVHADAAEFFARKVGGSWVPNYLEHRGLAAALEPGSGWQIGYAPAGWTALVDHLRDAGYADTTLEASGLATRARTGHLIDRFRDRMTLPILDEHDRAIAFVGRAHTDAGERTPKYLNSPTTAIYRKGDHLLTASRRPGTARTPVIVEGPLDAIAVSIASPDRHVPLAVCGTALTARHVELVSAIAGGPPSPVVVATDADAAGQAAACTSYRLLARAGLVPWSADLPPGVDPAALLETRGGSLRLSSGLQCSAYPLIDVVVDTRVSQWSDRLQWVEGKVGVVRELAPDLALLGPEQLQRQVQRLADLTGVEPETVRQEVRQSARSSCSGGRTSSAPSPRLADAPLTQPNAATASSVRGVFRVASATSSRGR